MSYNKIIIYIFIIILLISTSFVNAQTQQEKKEIYAIVTRITSSNNDMPAVYIENESAQIMDNDIISSNVVIITKDNQKIELILYQGEEIHSYIFIAENTDLTFNIDQVKSLISLNVKYGGIRVSLREKREINYNSETVRSISTNAEFGVISKVDINSNIREGYFIVFNGSLEVTSLRNASNKEIVQKYYMCQFTGFNVLKPKKISREIFSLWKSRMIFSVNSIIEDKNVYLEKMNFSDLDKMIAVNKDIDLKREEPLISETKDETSDIRKIDKAKLLADLLSIQISAIGFNNDIGIKFALDPSINFNDRFELGLYLPVYYAPYNTMNENRFMKVNGVNNEWSFGSDQGGAADRMVFDIFSDLLLKINKIKYTHPDKLFIINYGDIYDISDFLTYSLVSYNSFIFHPEYRKSSMSFKINFRWFEGTIYAEDVLPKGLYGLELMFMTPFTSNRLRFRLSSFFDFYNFMKFETEESFFPGQFNATVDYDAFNVNFMRFSLFSSFGAYMPFSYNNYTKTSLFKTLLDEMPPAMLNNFSASTGFVFRVLRFAIQSEFVYDSGLNKVGIFDNLYMIKRELNPDYIEDWMRLMLKRGIVHTDQHYGFRVLFNFEITKFIFIDLSYQMTFLEYYDKIYFKLLLDSNDEWKVRFAFFTLFELEYIGVSFQGLSNLRKNSILHMGLTISPLTGLDIDLRASIFPEIFVLSNPWHTGFMFDCGVKIKPLVMYQKIKNKNE
ncbi:MAG: hypothetical protein JXB50_00520 [Spirochaetes bacterium]|nr:hypothetical protein [Spirochaetota bacterium]